jgi:hypothetical protein
MVRAALITEKDFESLKNFLNKAQQAVKDNKNEEASIQLNSALDAIDDVVYDDH